MLSLLSKFLADPMAVICELLKIKYTGNGTQRGVSVRNVRLAVLENKPQLIEEEVGPCVWLVIPPDSTFFFFNPGSLALVQLLAAALQNFQKLESIRKNIAEGVSRPKVVFYCYFFF